MAPYTVSFALKGTVVRVELKDIKGGLLEQEYDCAVADLPELQVLQEEGGTTFSDPVHFSLRLQRVGQLVEVDGVLNAQVTMICGRCLQPFNQLLSEQFNLTFSPQKQEQDLVEETELASEELGADLLSG